MGGGGLGNLVVGARLDGVDKVGEADGILDEEDGDVVTDDIEVALIGIAGFQLATCSRGGGRVRYVVKHTILWRSREHHGQCRRNP